MPLTKKGKEIMKSMGKTYGSKKGKQVFYASKNAGKISGVDKGFYGHMNVDKQPVAKDVGCYGIGCSMACDCK